MTEINIKTYTNFKSIVIKISHQPWPIKLNPLGLKQPPRPDGSRRRLVDIENLNIETRFRQRECLNIDFE